MLLNELKSLKGMIIKYNISQEILYFTIYLKEACMNINMDPNILLSIINMKLRDFYNDVEDLCYDLDINRKELDEKLIKIGYNYNKKNNQYR